MNRRVPVEDEERIALQMLAEVSGGLREVLVRTRGGQGGGGQDEPAIACPCCFFFFKRFCPFIDPPDVVK